MEHRYAHRFSTHLKALIFRGGMPIAVGHILNFSRDGIFLKTEFQQIEINQQLEIEVIARSNSRSPIDYCERRLCKAFVVHKANGGLGLLMREDCAITQKHYAAIVANAVRSSVQVTYHDGENHEADRAATHPANRHAQTAHRGLVVNDFTHGSSPR